MFLIYFRAVTYTYLLLHTVLCQKLMINDLLKIVSKNDSKIWLDSLKVPVTNNNPYCNICCIDIKSETVGKRCGSHTLCKYPTENTGAACNGYIKIRFTSVEKETLLDAHNTLRNIIASGLESRGQPGPQPSSSNMRVLEWNDELALIAERWAAQCLYTNDICRDLDRFPVGQIIAHGNLATHNELSFIKKWYDEVQHFNSCNVGNLKMDSKSSTKRYTQLIWADTYQLGCARAVFQKSEGYEVIYREHFICNYGPSGNIPDQEAYRIGEPCTACHEGTTCTLQYPSLCGNQERIPKVIDSSAEEELKRARFKIKELMDNLKQVELKSNHGKISRYANGTESLKFSYLSIILSLFFTFCFCNIAF